MSRKTEKALLLDKNGKAINLDQWQAERKEIVAHLFNTLGWPPVARSVQGIETLDEEKLAPHIRRHIRYVVGEDNLVSVYLPLDFLPDRTPHPGDASDQTV